MASRAISIRLQRLTHRSLLLQAALVFEFWLAGQTLVKLIDLPIPGSFVRMLLVLLLLATKWMSVFSMRRGAEWFIANMVPPPGLTVSFCCTILSTCAERGG